MIVTLKDQLGNQMFAYASVRTFAEKNGYSFQYYLKENHLINSSDRKYGNTLPAIFSHDAERIEEIPSDLPVITDTELIRRYEKEGKKMILSLPENAVYDGHFIMSGFFDDNLDHVRQWFSFPDEIQKKTEEEINEIRRSPEEKIVGVHFRVGKDYLKYGFKLSENYWKQAAAAVNQKLSNVRFVCLYDKKEKTVEHFMKRYQALEQHGSLVEDMCFLSRCDAVITCNSSFSIMAALLNPKAEMIVCPDRYPTMNGDMIGKICPDSWMHIHGIHRSFLSQIMYIFWMVWYGHVFQKEE